MVQKNGFYFTHSYYAAYGPYATAETKNGLIITAICQSQNFFGVQFHPERSGEAGPKINQEFFKPRD